MCGDATAGVRVGCLGWVHGDVVVSGGGGLRAVLVSVARDACFGVLLLQCCGGGGLVDCGGVGV